jgi:hypothetical protein
MPDSEVGSCPDLQPIVVPRDSVGAYRTVGEASGIAYVFLGLEPGGRPKGGCPPDYELMASTSSLQSGARASGRQLGEQQ